MIINARGIVFSYVRNDNLKELTQHRAIASLPIGGRYRVVDFMLSNLVNSGVSNVGLITQSNYQSLLDHVGSGKEWDLSRKRDGLFILPPFARSNTDFAPTATFSGWLEALASIYTYIARSVNKYVILMGCDTICNIDLAALLQRHIEQSNRITCVYRRMQMQINQSRYRNLLEMGPDEKVEGLLFHAPYKGEACVDMGIYIIEKQALQDIITDAVARNRFSFSRDVLQQHLGDWPIRAYEFTDYAAPIDTVESYFRVNMDMLRADVRADLFRAQRPIYTKVRDEMPTLHTEDADAADSLIADGCLIEGEVRNSILFRGVHVARGARVHNCILYQGSQVERNAHLNYCVVDKDATIRNGRMLMGYERHPVLIEKGAVV